MGTDQRIRGHKLVSHCCYGACLGFSFVITTVTLAAMFWIVWCYFGISLVPFSESQRRAIVNYSYATTKQPTTSPSTYPPEFFETSANQISKLATASSNFPRHESPSLLEKRKELVPNRTPNLAKGDFAVRERNEKTLEHDPPPKTISSNATKRVVTPILEKTSERQSNEGTAALNRENVQVRSASSTSPSEQTLKESDRNVQKEGTAQINRESNQRDEESVKISTPHPDERHHVNDDKIATPNEKSIAIVNTEDPVINPAQTSKDSFHPDPDFEKDNSRITVIDDVRRGYEAKDTQGRDRGRGGGDQYSKGDKRVLPDIEPPLREASRSINEERYRDRLIVGNKSLDSNSGRIRGESDKYNDRPFREDRYHDRYPVDDEYYTDDRKLEGSKRDDIPIRVNSTRIRASSNDRYPNGRGSSDGKYYDISEKDDKYKSRILDDERYFETKRIDDSRDRYLDRYPDERRRIEGSKGYDDRPDDRYKDSNVGRYPDDRSRIEDIDRYDERLVKEDGYRDKIVREMHETDTRQKDRDSRYRDRYYDDKTDDRDRYRGEDRPQDDYIKIDRNRRIKDDRDRLRDYDRERRLGDDRDRRIDDDRDRRIDDDRDRRIDDDRDRRIDDDRDRRIDGDRGRRIDDDRDRRRDDDRDRRRDDDRDRRREENRDRLRDDDRYRRIDDDRDRRRDYEQDRRIEYDRDRSGDDEREKRRDADRVKLRDRYIDRDEGRLIERSRDKTSTTDYITDEYRRVPATLVGDIRSVTRTRDIHRDSLLSSRADYQPDLDKTIPRREIYSTRNERGDNFGDGFDKDNSRSYIRDDITKSRKDETIEDRYRSGYGDDIYEKPRRIEERDRISPTRVTDDSHISRSYKEETYDDRWKDESFYINSRTVPATRNTRYESDKSDSRIPTRIESSKITDEAAKEYRSNPINEKRDNTNSRTDELNVDRRSYSSEDDGYRESSNSKSRLPSNLNNRESTSYYASKYDYSPDEYRPRYDDESREYRPNRRTYYDTSNSRDRDAYIRDDDSTYSRDESKNIRNSGYLDRDQDRRDRNRDGYRDYDERTSERERDIRNRGENRRSSDHYDSRDHDRYLPPDEKRKDRPDSTGLRTSVRDELTDTRFRPSRSGNIPPRNSESDQRYTTDQSSTRYENSDSQSRSTRRRDAPLRSTVSRTGTRLPLEGDILGKIIPDPPSVASRSDSRSKEPGRRDISVDRSPDFEDDQPLSAKDVIEAALRHSENSEQNSRKVFYPVFDPRVSNLTSPDIIRPSERRGTTITAKKRRKREMKA